MTPSWTDYQGLAVHAWQLDSFLGIRGAAACYEGKDPDGRVALIQIVPADERGAGQMARSWDAARDLADPHLLRVHDTGSTAIGETSAYYAALEMPEDDLGELLSRRRIDEDEARTIVATVADALDYLHSRGLRHGSVVPSNIMFAGDSPKLSVDTLAPADDSGRDADLQQLGSTITEMMTGQRTADAAGQLPPALRELVSGCWSGSDGGWTAARVADVASGRAPATPVEDTNAEQVDAVPDRPVVPRAPKVIRVRWPVIALAAVALFAGIFYLRRHTPASNAPVPSATPASTPVAPPAAVPAPPQDGAEASRFAPKDRSNSWAVVAATYSDFDAAQKRAHKLPRRLGAHVYPSRGSGHRYYVLLGSGLSSAGARKARARSMRMGAPRDTYVTILPQS